MFQMPTFVSAIFRSAPAAVAEAVTNTETPTETKEREYARLTAELAAKQSQINELKRLANADEKFWRRTGKNDVRIAQEKDLEKNGWVYLNAELTKQGLSSRGTTSQLASRLAEFLSLQALGWETLNAELQRRGLPDRGTTVELAARLTPIMEASGI